MDSSLNIASAASAAASTARKPASQAAGKPLPGTGNAGGNPLPPAATPAPAPERIEQAVQQIQSYLSDSQRQLHFQVDPSSGRTIVRVVNPETGEVIRQIPGEEVLKLARAIGPHGGRILSDLA